MKRQLLILAIQPACGQSHVPGFFLPDGMRIVAPSFCAEAIAYLNLLAEEVDILVGGVVEELVQVVLDHYLGYDIVGNDTGFEKVQITRGGTGKFEEEMVGGDEVKSGVTNDEEIISEEGDAFQLAYFVVFVGIELERVLFFAVDRRSHGGAGENAGIFDEFFLEGGGEVGFAFVQAVVEKCRHEEYLHCARDGIVRVLDAQKVIDSFLQASPNSTVIRVEYGPNVNQLLEPGIVEGEMVTSVEAGPDRTIPWYVLGFISPQR